MMENILISIVMGTLRGGRLIIKLALDAVSPRGSRHGRELPAQVQYDALPLLQHQQRV